jgi:hypothetical protein
MSREYSAGRSAFDSVAILVVLVCVLCWPGLLIGFGLRWLMRAVPRGPVQRGFWLLVGVLGLAGGAAFYFLGHPLVPLNAVVDAAIARNWPQVLRALVSWWVLTLWLAPLLAVFVAAFERPNTEQQLLRRSAFKHITQAMQSRRARERVERGAPDMLKGVPVLGAAIAGDLEGWVRSGWVCFPVPELQRPGVVLGESRAGKTTTLLRLAYLVAKYLKWRVIFLDVKGDESLAADFTAAMKRADVAGEDLRVFPHTPYNGWYGDTHAIFNRLVGIVRSSEPYYKDILKMVLDLALKAFPSPPRSSSRLLTSMGLSFLEAIYEGRPEQAEVESLNKRDAAGARNRYRAFFAALDGRLDGRWTFDEARASFIMLEGLALREESRALGRFFVEELAHYAGKRKPREERVLIIIDDASALALGEEVTGLVERLAGFNAYVWLSAQSFEGLGQYNRAIVGAVTSRVLHRLSDPEGVIGRAGTRDEVHQGWQAEPDRGSGGRTTFQVEEVPNIHGDEVKRLETGEAVIISHGRYEKVHVSPLLISPTQHEEARQYLERLVLIETAKREAKIGKNAETTVSSEEATEEVRVVEADPVPAGGSEQAPLLLGNGENIPPAPPTLDDPIVEQGPLTLPGGDE